MTKLDPSVAKALVDGIRMVCTDREYRQILLHDPKVRSFIYECFYHEHKRLKAKDSRLIVDPMSVARAAGEMGGM